MTNYQHKSTNVILFAIFVVLVLNLLIDLIPFIVAGNMLKSIFG